MLYRVMGRAGSGKTDYILYQLKTAYRSGRRCLYIVPEQHSLSAEKKLLEFLGDGCNMSVEVLNFERLPERIARDHGNLAINYTDNGTRDILMSLTLEKLSSGLDEYKGVSGNSDFVMSMITVINRFKMAGITSEKLENVLEDDSIKSDCKLYRKLKDISLIYKNYQESFCNSLSDPCDALTNLAEQLETNMFFKEYTVFIDGYYTFTEQEYEIIRHILKQSENTYIAFTCDYAGSVLFSDNRASADRIKRFMGGDRFCEDVFTGECKRQKSPELLHIEKYLWEAQTVPLETESDAVRIIEAKNSFEEAEAIASEIIRLTRDKGLRYRDISVVFGGLSDYEGIIDVVLERNNIPFYMAVKDELGTKPLFSFVFACLEAVINDFSIKSIKKYIKSGFSPLTVGESDILLRYAEMWDIRGKMWYGEDEWNMNPDGYAETFTSSAGKILIIVNRAREKIAPYLANLRQTLTKKNITVTSAIKALYEHLCETEVDKKLFEKAQLLRDASDEENAQKERQLWDMLINIFDQLHSVCGNEVIELSRLYELIKIMSEEYEVGSIPTSVDQVRISDAALFRSDSCKAQILGGVIDGVFPAYAASDSFFENEELMALEQAGCPLGISRLQKQNRERFLFYAAACAPSHYLTVTYPVGDLSGTKKRPSLAVTRIQKLLSSLKTYKFGQHQTDYLYSVESAKFYYNYINDPIIKEELKKALAENGFYPTCNNDSFFDSEARINCNDKTIAFSPSKIERYAYCPFSYFTSYILKLKKNGKIKFATPEIGTFIHKILEQFLSSRTVKGVFRVPEDMEIEQETESLSAKYFLDVVGGAEGKSKRFLNTYENLKKTLRIVLKNLSDEFAESRFVPEGFEVKIGYGEGETLPCIRYALKDGKEALLRGSIDRVDSYKKDGINYIRVVDYKTYSKDFSLELIDEGIDTQMLDYLFAYCSADKNRRPAGVLYYPAKLPFVDADKLKEGEDIEKAVRAKLKQTGIILRDSDIVNAMDNSGDGRFIPVKIKKDGSFDSRCENRMLDADGFSLLEKRLEEQIKSLAERALDGDMCIDPKKIDEKHDACRYCDYKSVCRYTE